MIVTGKKLLENVASNVILVDYGSVSYCNYAYLAKIFLNDLAEYLAKCIKKWNLKLNKINIIGHSLGAHVAGVTGTHLNGTIDEIIGLYRLKY